MNIKNFIIKHKKIFLSILITIFIEIFICNFPFFRTIITGNTNLKAEYTYTNSINQISIQNINTRITSIKINYKDNIKDKISYDLSYKAEESSNTIYLNKKTLLKHNNHYINFDTHSKCKNINLYLTTDNQNLTIDSIILNHPNLNISIIRIIIIFTFIIFIIKIKNKSIYIKQYNKDSKQQKKIFKFNLFMFCSLITIYAICQHSPRTFFIEKENINKEDSILMQTEAIMNGQIHLTEEPDQLLNKMKNPYDYYQRQIQGINYLYDVAYYKGKYYNYFGITPILTSILPFRIITGKYTHTYIFNLIYLFISIASLYSLYKKLINKYIKNLSLCNFYLGFYTIIFASNIFTLIRGLKYDIVLTSGISFLLISLNLAISLYNNHKHKTLKLILLGITTSLIVLSKPNLIIYYFLILFFIIISFKNLNIKEKIKNYSLIIIPLSIFAIFQMFLNYIRFDNILEFGAKYQLTSFNMNYCMSITFGKIYAGLMEYIFKTPTVNPLQFPFIFTNNNISLISINETLYENRLIGLISIPILYIYLIKDNILKKANNKELKKFINISITTTILSIIIYTCFGGICETYSIDFKLILSISAVILSLKWVEQNKNNQDINNIFLLLCISTIIIMIPISLTTESNFLASNSRDLTIFFKNIFEFWT